MKTSIKLPHQKTTRRQHLIRWSVISSIFAVLWLLPFRHSVSAASPVPSTSPKVAAVKATSKTATVSATKASPTPSATPAPSPSDEATENLKDRIDRVLEQRQEKLRELEDSGQRRRLFIGEVQRIIEQTVTLRTRRGNQTFSVTPDLKLTRDGKKATIDDIAVGDTVAIVGFLDKENIQPQRVLIFSSSLQPSALETTLGTIKDVTRTQITITDKQQIDRKFSFAKTTEFQDQDGKVSKREDLKKGDSVLIVTKSLSDNTPLISIRTVSRQ